MTNNIPTYAQILEVTQTPWGVLQTIRNQILEKQESLSTIDPRSQFDIYNKLGTELMDAFSSAIDAQKRVFSAYAFYSAVIAERPSELYSAFCQIDERTFQILCRDMPLDRVSQFFGYYPPLAEALAKGGSKDPELLRLFMIGAGAFTAGIFGVMKFDGTVAILIAIGGAVVGFFLSEGEIQSMQSKNRSERLVKIAATFPRGFDQRYSY